MKTREQAQRYEVFGPDLRDCLEALTRERDRIQNCIEVLTRGMEMGLLGCQHKLSARREGLTTMNEQSTDACS